MSTTRASVVIAAGGTGGHVFPGLAVAEKLRGKNVRVVWFGSNKGVEAGYVSRTDYPFEGLAISGVRRTGLLNWWLLPWRLTFALLHAWRLLRKYRPNVVLGMGGFVAGPVGLAAYTLDIPLVIHEQNTIAGLTNRWLALLSRRVLLGFPGALKSRAATEWVGNPVREELLGRPEPRERLRGRSGLRLLVLGGSRGAAILNAVVPGALAQVQARGVEGLEVRHQTGAGKREGVGELYAGLGVARVRVDAFIDDIGAALSWADLVVCRSGAQTLAELSALGAASILVPFPHAVDDHQTCNAEYFARNGAARLLPQARLSEGTLAAEILRLVDDRERLVEMAECAREQARPHAGERVAAVCCEEMGARGS